MNLAVITDEIDDDLEHALDVMAEYGVGGVELRQLWNTHVIETTTEQKERAKAAIAKRGMKVVGIASPFYKCDLPGESGEGPTGSLHSASAVGLGEQIDLLHRSFETARFFDTKLIRIFTFWKRRAFSPEIEDQIVDLLAEPVALAESEGFVLGLENEHACYAGTGAQAARVIERIGSPALRAIWDPGNAYFDGERPYPNGYEAVEKLIAHVHVKDAAVSKATGKPEWTIVGEGEIDWIGQIAKLHRSGYADYLSLETHYAGGSGKEASSRVCLEGLQRIVAATAA